MPDHTTEDRRKHKRKAFDIQNSEVHFKLKINDETQEIYQVHDISITGMRISLAEAKLDVAQELTLLVSEADLALSVVAVVRWVGPGSESDIYEYGVEFDNSDMDLNILLFMYLRKHLSQL
ncbi:hypothetical protein MNBD_GAMMA16-1713 [hydrothermal vent metagenome]|uniref:PilZ domain-containing protein n=1 Tax=hydrothermal vent metagenome TaxID=652676 RepID=A0A3B0ZCL4_9ZZZZ